MVFDIGKRRRPGGLGSKKHIWSPKETSNLPIRFYTPTAGRVQVNIENEKGVIYGNYIQVQEGVNVYEFDYSIGSAGLAYLKSDKKDKIEAADDGKYYLPAGEYTISLTQGNDKASTKFELK